MSTEIKDWRKDSKQVKGLVQRQETAFRRLQDMDATILSLYYAVPGEVAARSTDPAGRIFGILDSIRQQGDNLLLEIVDAAVAMIASRPLQCKVAPNGGEADMQRACDLASLLVNGIFESSGFLHIATRAYRDGCLAWGGPAIGWYDKTSNEIRFTRLLPEQTFWIEDGTEKPRVMFTVGPVPRANWIAQYPAKASQLRDVKTWEPPPMPGVDTLVPISKDADTIKGVEIWCTTVGADKGRHMVMAIDGDVALLDEEYDEKEHQIIAFKWSPDHRGFAGKSLGRTVVNDHVQNNMMLASIQKALQSAGAKIIGNEGAMVNFNVSNVDYEKITVPDGMPLPQIMVPNVVSKEMLEEVARRRTGAFAKAGINQAAAAGEKPTGLASGKALREFVGIAAARLVTQQAAYEQFWKDAARVIIMLAKKAYVKKAAQIAAPGTDLLAEIAWSEIDLQEGKYKVSFSLLAGSGLSEAERLEDLNDLQQSGQIDVQDVLANVSNPDIQTLLDRVTARRQLVNRVIAKALKHGIPTAPDPVVHDLEALVTIGSQWMALAELRRDAGIYTAEGIAALSTTVANAKAKMEAAAPPPAPPAPPAAPGMTAPVPGPPPGTVGVPPLPGPMS